MAVKIFKKQLKQNQQICFIPQKVFTPPCKIITKLLAQVILFGGWKILENMMIDYD
jgi:hypothetical protein